MTTPDDRSGRQPDRRKLDGAKLDGAKLGAAAVSLLVLIGLFWTSIGRAPEPLWTVVLGVLIVGLAIAITVGVARGRRHGRFRR